MGMKQKTLVYLLTLYMYCYSSGCKETKKGTEYNGIINTTKGCNACQDWAAQTPHHHKFDKKEKLEKNNLKKNYCRNPDGETEGPWCYTLDENMRWEYCDVPFCDSIKEGDNKSQTVCPTTVTEQTPTEITQSSTYPGECACSCNKMNRNGQQYDSKSIESKVINLRKELLIDKKNTSIYRRAKMCSRDDRVSSFSMGIIAINIILLPMVLAVINDVLNRVFH